MKTNDILKEQEFVELTAAKLDAKNRVYLGRTEGVPTAILYKVYRNAMGQIILDPQVTIPASEAWIFQNKTVLASIRSGLKDAKEGRVKKSKEDFTQYLKDTDPDD